MFCFPALNIPHVEVDDSKFNTKYANVFVHGLAGWGSYEWYDDFMPYWGMFGGDLMQYLNARGFECYSASSTPREAHGTEPVSSMPSSPAPLPTTARSIPSAAATPDTARISHPIRLLTSGAPRKR